MDIYKKTFEDFLNITLTEEGSSELMAPVAYIVNLGGKRFRPVLCLMAHHLFDSDYKKSLPQAYALEVFHNFTLMHDDIMDDASLRRNADTVHIKWDVNTAILSGDAALILAYEHLIQNVDGNTLAQILSTFNKMAIEVCEGQMSDMSFEKRDVVSIEEYVEMIKGKTSVLLGACLKIGALNGGAKLEDADLLYDFGVACGVAFQIQDDILDLYGDQSVGKKIGGDVLQGKKTILYAQALETLTGKDREKFILQYASEDGDKKIQSVRATFDQLKIKEQAEALQEEYYNKAMRSLSLLQVDANRKKALERVGEQLFRRKY